MPNADPPRRWQQPVNVAAFCGGGWLNALAPTGNAVKDFHSRISQQELKTRYHGRRGTLWGPRPPGKSVLVSEDSESFTALPFWSFRANQLAIIPSARSINCAYSNCAVARYRTIIRLEKTASLLFNCIVTSRVIPAKSGEFICPLTISSAPTNFVNRRPQSQSTFLRPVL